MEFRQNRAQRGEGIAACGAPAPVADARVSGECLPFGHVAPQLTVCYGTARFSRGERARRRFPRKCKVPLNFNGLAPTVRDGAEPAELPERVLDVAGEGAIVTGMAGRYALALFELALERNAVDAVKADLERFGALTAESADLSRLVRSPVFGAEDQVRALKAVLDAVGIGGISAQFLLVVASNRRLFAVRDMIKDYRRLVARHKGEVTAEVTFAERPGEAHLSAITDALKAVTRKDVQVDVKVDPAIIGGLVVKLGSRMVDSSLRTKLNAIKHAMKEVS
jgi:F-type H+-transporting ATPase subunit delta